MARHPHMLEQPLHVTHSQELGNERLWGELLQIIQMFSYTEEDDRRLGSRDAVTR